MSENPPQTPPFRTHAELLALFKPLSRVSKALGVGYITAVQWRNRNRIPVDYWRRLMALIETDCGITVTWDELEAGYMAAKTGPRTDAGVEEAA